MAVCPGIKRDGTRCTVAVDGPHKYCYQHDPDRADERQRNASRAGKSKPSREIGDLKKQLEDLADDVLVGKVERGNAVVVNQIINTRTRLIELERKIREEDELVERLEALEQAQSGEQGGRRRWQA